MTLPPIFDRGRGLSLCLLALNGFLQAGVAIFLAALGSQMLAQIGGASGTMDIAVAGWTIGGPLAGLLLTASAMLLIALRVAQRRGAEAFALSYVKLLRSTLFSHVLAMPKTSPKLRFGLVMTRIVNDFSAIKLWLAQGLVTLVVSACVVVGVLGFLAFAMPTLALALLPGLAVWAAIVGLSLAPLKRAIREARRHRGRLAAFAGSALSSRLALAHFGRSGLTIRRIDRRTDKMNDALVRRAGHSGLLRSSGEILFPAIVIGLAIFGARGSVLDGATLNFAMLLAGLLVVQLNGTALAADYRMGHGEAMARLKTVLAQPNLEGATGGHGSATAETKRPSPARDGAGYALEVIALTTEAGRRPISLSLSPGEIRKLDDGPSEEQAAIFEQIAGLEKPVSGEIRIDSRSMAETGLRDWRRMVTLVSPAVPFVRGTVDDNLALGAPSSLDAAEVDMVKALFSLEALCPATEITEDTTIPPQVAARLRAARALTRHVGLVLIDDPVLAADSAVFDLLIAALKQRGTTVLIASG